MKRTERKQRVRRFVYGVRAVPAMLGLAAVAGNPVNARATVACSFAERHLGSYVLASPDGKGADLCEVKRVANVLDAAGREVMKLGKVLPSTDFQLVGDRYLLWQEGPMIRQADLRTRTFSIVLDRSPDGPLQYLASPGHSRIGLVWPGLISWAPVTGVATASENLLYRSARYTMVTQERWTPRPSAPWYRLVPYREPTHQPPEPPEQPEDEGLRLIAWSSDDRTLWFCRREFPSHRSRLVAAHIDRFATTSAVFTGLVPACHHSYRVYDQLIPGFLDPDRGLYFQFIDDRDSFEFMHLELHDLYRGRRADLGKVPLPTVGARVGEEEAATLHPDGSCSWNTLKGRRHVPQAESLFLQGP